MAEDSGLEPESWGFKSLHPHFNMNRDITHSAIVKSNIDGAIILWIEYSGHIDGNRVWDPNILKYLDLHENGSYDRDSMIFADLTGIIR